MGHRINSQGEFQSDKHPDLPPDRIRLNLANPRSKRALLALAEDYEDTEPGLADDLRKRLAELHAVVSGVELIAIERRRQQSVKGYGADHDDIHTDGTIAVVAAALAVNGTDAMVRDALERVGGETRGVHEDHWGLVAKHKGDRVRQLVIAGALIAAEIDREQRIQAR